MIDIDFDDLMCYLRDNIEDFRLRVELAIDLGWKQHIMPSQADKTLTDTIYMVAEEYAEMDDDEFDEYLEEKIDDIYFYEFYKR